MAKRMLPTLQELLKTPPLSAAARLSRGDSPGLQVVCFGDSVTGLYYHTGGQQAYTDLLEIGLRRLFPAVEATAIHAYNAGVSGNTTANGLKRIQSDVLARRPDVVTVMFGLNDLVRVPLDDFRKNLQSIVAQCRDAGAEVVLCTPNNVITTGGRPAEKLVDYCDAVRGVAREMDVALCDVHRELAALRAVNELSWRLLMSDEIHPNMDGHKRIAELLARAIAGRAVSVADVRPPADPLRHVRLRVQQRQPVKVVAMAPVAEHWETALKEAFPGAALEITVWETAGKSLAKLEQEARDTVRAAKPDLVALAIPPDELTEEWPALRSYTWIMNWSLSFGRQEWDCIVAHPRVLEPGRDGAKAPQAAQDALIRRLVRAQHLPLLDREAGDSRPPLALFQALTAAK